MTASAPRRKALVIVNRRARRGSEAIDDALDRLDDGGIDLVAVESAEPEAISDHIERHRADIDLVIAGGGDGTLNGVAQLLHGGELPLGILPLGTANDLARTLGIRPDLDHAVDVILAGHIRRLDLGEVNGRVFFNVASLGYSVELAKSLTSEAKKRWGTFGYAIAAMRVLGQMRPFTVFIEEGGVTRRAKTLQVAVGNGRFYGGGMVVEESARPDDGALDVYSLEFENWWQLPAIVPALRRGQQGRHPAVRTLKTNELTIRARRPHQVNADGEIVTVTPATFRVVPKAIGIYAPLEIALK